MTDSALIEIAFFTVTGLGTLLMIAYDAGRRRKAMNADMQAFTHAIAADPVLEVRSISEDNEIHIALRDQLHPHTLRATQVHNGQAFVPTWQFDASIALPVDRMRIVASSLFAGIRKAIGRGDIHIGDASFDDALSVQGSHTDQIRAWLMQKDVQRLVRAIFEATDAWSIDYAAGTLTIVTRRDTMSSDDVRLRLLFGCQLTEALHAVRDIPPAIARQDEDKAHHEDEVAPDDQSAQTESMTSTLTATEGSPVAVPGFKVRS